MNVFQLFLKSYDLLKYNLVIVQPLLIFLFLLSIFLAPVTVATQVVNIFILLLAMFGLLAAFLAGWFNMFHKCTANYTNLNVTEEERALNSLSLFKEFFPGVGEYFYRTLLGLILFVLLFIIITNLAGFIGEHFIGLPAGFNPDKYKTTGIAYEEAVKLFSQIPKSSKIKWYVLLFGSVLAYFYLTMFWLHFVVVEKKSAVKSFLISIKTTITKPLVPLIIFSTFITSFFGIIILTVLIPQNLITQLISLFLFIMIIVYFTMMSFVYFEEIRKNSSDSRSNSFR